MTGEERRRELLKTIRGSVRPISGTALAGKFQVSRQIIVQDIALLRMKYPEIYSTPKGYCIAGMPQQDRVLPDPGTAAVPEVRRVFHVSHSDSQIEDELNAIVDMGGKVLDVFIEHGMYGSIRAELSVQCRRHVQKFMEGIRSGKSSPLKNLTSGVHYHTVEADSEETLDLIEQELEKRGYLVK